jgi:hypothetical protein
MLSCAGRRGALGQDVRPGAAAPARLRRAGRGALELPHRAVPAGALLHVPRGGVGPPVFRQVMVVCLQSANEDEEFIPVMKRTERMQV